MSDDNITYRILPFAMPELPVCASVSAFGFNFDAYGKTKADAKQRLQKKLEEFMLAKARFDEEEDPKGGAR